MGGAATSRTPDGFVVEKDSTSLPTDDRSGSIGPFAAVSEYLCTNYGSACGAAPTGRSYVSILVWVRITVHDLKYSCIIL